MEKMRVIQLVNGKEVVGLESEFVTSHNTNHNSTIIIHRAKHSESIIYPRHIAMDTFIDQEAMRIEDEKRRKQLEEREKNKLRHYSGTLVLDIPNKKKSKPKAKSFEQLQKKYGIKPARPKKAKRNKIKKKK